jgi:hypothetical protein
LNSLLFSGLPLEFTLNLIGGRNDKKENLLNKQNAPMGRFYIILEA